MRKLILCILTINILFVLVSTNDKSAFAITGSNSGLAGLWEYPTAEIPDDGAGRFGYTHASPYAYYFIDLAWLPWFEVNARLTTFDTIMLDTGRYYMDKAIDFKAMLYYNRDPKKWFLPSIAFGMTDVTGTELMKAYYGVATWKFGRVSASVGYGSDRMNGVFAGLAWDIDNWLTIKAEYSPMDYMSDSASGQKVMREEPSEKYNVGVTLKAPWGTEISGSYQRGDEFVFTASQRLNLGGPYIGENKKPNYGMPGDARVAEWDDAEIPILVERVKSGLEKYIKVRDVDLKIYEEESENDDGEIIYSRKLMLAYENYGHASHAEAMVRILVVLSAIMPEMDEIILIQKISSNPVVCAIFPGEILFDIRTRELRDEDNPMKGVKFSWASPDMKDFGDDNENLYLDSRGRHELKGMLVYEPRIDQTLESEYRDRVDFDLIYKGRYSNGFGSIVDVRFPLHNEVKIWWEPDMNDNIRIQNAALNYVTSIGENNRFWLMSEGGYMDEEWFGGNVWGRYYAQNGNWWLGTRLSGLRMRDPESFAGLLEGQMAFGWRGNVYKYYDDTTKDAWRFAAWVQVGYHFDTFDIDLQADWGRFIDEDKGVKISAIRHWDDTAIGFWYTNTDVDAPGKSFTKAGIHMELPAEKWLGTLFGQPSEHIWEQDSMFLSIWELESGRDAGYIRTPERLLGQMRPNVMKNNVGKLLREFCAYEDVSDRDGENLDEDHQQIRSILDYVLR